MSNDAQLSIAKGFVGSNVFIYAQFSWVCKFFCVLYFILFELKTRFYFLGRIKSNFQTFWNVLSFIQTIPRQISERRTVICSRIMISKSTTPKQCSQTLWVHNRCLCDLVLDFFFEILPELILLNTDILHSLIQNVSQLLVVIRNQKAVVHIPKDNILKIYFRLPWKGLFVCFVIDFKFFSSFLQSFNN